MTPLALITVAWTTLFTNIPSPIIRTPPKDCLLARADGDICATHPLGPAIECGPEEEPQTSEKCNAVLEQNEDMCSSDYVACREAMRVAECGTCPAECEHVWGACDFTSTTTTTLPDPIFRGCAPPANFCAQLETDCNASGLDGERCTVIGQGICPGSKCLAVEAVANSCIVEGADCGVMLKTADTGLTACDCQDIDCEPTAELAVVNLLAVCLAHPLALGDDCEEPSAGACMTTISWAGCAQLSTCEYIECSRTLAKMDECPMVLPSSCGTVQDCVDAEENG